MARFALAGGWVALAGLLAGLLALGPGVARADSASLLAQAQAADPTRYAAVVALKTEVRATTDNLAFSMWWQPAGWQPGGGVIVPLHGHAGWATDGISLWQPYAQQRGYAILSLQWWFGQGEASTDYYRPDQIYPLLDSLLLAKGVKPGTVFFNGFSRGSANSYAVAAWDAASTGRRWFALVLSNAGGVVTDYPPNRQIEQGQFGAAPFHGLRWAMYCGGKDPEPQRDGCPAMGAARDWVIRLGADMRLFIEDPQGDHGGFMLDSANVETALATYAAALASRPAALSRFEADCLFDWGEDHYADLLRPRRPASLALAPYYYRSYPGSGSHVGVSGTDDHLYFMDNLGRLTDLGGAADWSTRAGCR